MKQYQNIILMVVIASLMWACDPPPQKELPNKNFIEEEENDIASTIEREKTHDHASHTHPSGADGSNADAPENVKSPRVATMVMMGDNHIHIDYSSPRVRGRMIFGGLVAYDEVWVTGAHSATSIAFDKDVIIQDKRIPAGKYGFFTIPGQKEWTVILNEVWDMHLADDYDEQKDVLRFNVSPKILLESEERLIYTIDKKSDELSTVSMSWDIIGISFDVLAPITSDNSSF